MLPVEPLASASGSRHTQIQRRDAQRAKSAFYRELLARRNDAYTTSEALPTPAEDQPAPGETQNDHWVRATMTFPGGVSVTLERTSSEQDEQTTTSLSLTRRHNAVRRPAPLPRRLDIRV
jgi:hypothetical protein